MDIESWLSELGLDRYAEAFRENDVDAELLGSLTAEDLKEIGVTSVGHRRRLLEAIAARSRVGDHAAPVDAPPAVSAAPAGAERRQLTVMFVDLVGSTALSARLDPETMSEVLRSYQNTVAGEIGRFEGQVAKFMGDGVLAYFGWPIAHEDEAERAVRAGLAIVEALTGLASPVDEPLQARIGIATGLVVVGELIGEGVAQEQTVVGDTPNLAARLQALATPGQVVIAETTRRLLGGGFALDDLGEHRLKGIDRPAPVFAVASERAVQSRFEARGDSVQPMVGRDQEIALLRERWAQAKEGEGQAVLLVGEAGVGKSRISRALLDALSPEPHTRIRYQCSPYHSDSALWPVIQQIGHAAGFAAEESAEGRLDKLEALLIQSGQASDAAALIANLIGIDGTDRYGARELSPQAERARTMAALTGQLIGLSRKQPVLLLLEDAHWIDPTTLELIELCLDAVSTAPVLMLLTSRPDHQPALAGHPHVTRLSLNRLGRAGAEAIIARLGGGHLPSATVEAIIARTDGVPLYVEELTKAVLETGETAIPASLHDSLMARLDRTPEVKDVAQIAACIGREFDYALIASVTDQAEAELERALDRLAAAELVFRRGTPPEARYTFKHALVRDAAYESLLRTRRRELHGRIANALQQQFAALVADQPELVARHLTEAGLAEAAIPLWQQAAQHAAARSAYVEAITHFRQALAQLDTLPDGDARQRQELALQTQLAGPLIAINGYGAPETAACFARAQQLSEKIDDPELMFPVLYGQWANKLSWAEHAQALEFADRFLALAHARNDAEPLLMGNRLRGISLCYLGRTMEVVPHLERTIDLYDPERHRSLALRFGQDPNVAALTFLALAKWELGFPDQAAEASHRALDQAREDGHANTLAYALAFLNMMHHCRRDDAMVARLGRELSDFATTRGMAMWQQFAEVAIGWAASSEVSHRQGVDTMHQALERLDEICGLSRPFNQALLAEGLLARGARRQSLAVLDDAMAIAERHQELWLECDLLRRKGLILLATNRDEAEGEALLDQALAIARRRQTRSWELRASRDLARLWAERGERQRALDLLSPVYGWFTEGFATPDLLEAKTLLDEL